MLFPILVDMCIDGLCIGIATNGKYETGGLLIAIGNCIECIFVTLALGLFMKKKKCNSFKIIMAGVYIGISIVVGALIGAVCGSLLKHTIAFAGFMSFGVVALLWLVVEELMKESHAEIEKKYEKEPIIINIGFFGGFLIMTILHRLLI